MGIVGGGSPTDAFRDVFFREGGSPSTPFIGSRFFSPSKDYVVGGMLELHVTSNWSMEVDGLFRQLHMTSAGVLADGFLGSNPPSPVVTWEFPVMAKYRFQERRLRPFLEAGPSFRTTGNLNGANPSHTGVTAGLGMETHWRSLNIAPVARYTRWSRDDVSQANPSTAQDQVELLLGFSHQAESIWRPLGRRMSLGLVLANNLTGDFRMTTQKLFILNGSLSGSVTSIDSSGPRGFIVGPTLEFQLPNHLSLEVDALHRPVTSVSELIYSDGTRNRSTSRGVTWEFPVLAKYRLPIRGAVPILELGPSFRLPQQALTLASAFGIAVGTGVEVQTGQLKVTPAVRYTHWGADKLMGIQKTAQNQIEVLAGLSF